MLTQKQTYSRDYHVSFSPVMGKLPPCSLQMGLFSAGKQSGCCEAMLLAVPCGEGGLVGMGEVKGDCVPIFFISADLAAAAAISIISCIC